jgi:hypothetical protein
MPTFVPAKPDHPQRDPWFERYRTMTPDQLRSFIEAARQERNRQIADAFCTGLRMAGRALGTSIRRALERRQ